MRSRKPLAVSRVPASTTEATPITSELTAGTSRIHQSIFTQVFSRQKTRGFSVTCISCSAYVRILEDKCERQRAPFTETQRESRVPRYLNRYLSYILTSHERAIWMLRIPFAWECCWSVRSRPRDAMESISVTPFQPGTPLDCEKQRRDNERAIMPCCIRVQSQARILTC